MQANQSFICSYAVSKTDCLVPHCRCKHLLARARQSYDARMMAVTARKRNWAFVLTFVFSAIYCSAITPEMAGIRRMDWKFIDAPNTCTIYCIRSYAYMQQISYIFGKNLFFFWFSVRLRPTNNNKIHLKNKKTKNYLWALTKLNGTDGHHYIFLVRCWRLPKIIIIIVNHVRFLLISPFHKSKYNNKIIIELNWAKKDEESNGTAAIQWYIFVFFCCWFNCIRLLWRIAWGGENGSIKNLYIAKCSSFNRQLAHFRNQIAAHVVTNNNEQFICHHVRSCYNRISISLRSGN